MKPVTFLFVMTVLMLTVKDFLTNADAASLFCELIETPHSNGFMTQNVLPAAIALLNR